ncbi:MAG TPA: M48 family metallopeptidase [Candidatus Saccharimonadales bacterium]|nr:M48 family metallopeptidase [Candidatus Saccharimonadales bacterium]
MLLILGFALVVGALAYIFGQVFLPQGGVAMLPVAFAFSGGSALVSYFAGDKLVLAQSRARPVGPDEQLELRNIVEALGIGLGIPTPALYLIDDSAPNAFATGRDPKHASVVVTTGLLDKLDREELEGVIAHELSHVGNRDIRVMLLVTVMVGTIALLADWLMRSMFWGGGRSRDDRDRGGGGLFMILGLVLALLTPLIAGLVQMAVSRQREYLADASGALLTRHPQGLANALRKIATDREPLEVANKATASLYFANPLKDRPIQFDRLFDTHPPIEERIRRLEAM